ncbi:MAG TPA: hypothetical protein PLR88_08855 [Bacteroidales bacterium]|nr:hypothetical protein [Bacteroidales bacterium]HPT22039.1 hypothetical protein [Bacteroidales bacterium]
MKSSEIKKIMISSLDTDANLSEISGKLEEEGVTYDFSNNFREKVIDRIFSPGLIINRKLEFMRSMNFAFYRIAFTGVAAIVILLISIFLMEGSISLNSFLGLKDIDDESVICLLTGN